MSNQKVYYWFNADCDPLHLSSKGYIDKYKSKLSSLSDSELAQESYIGLIRYFDNECRKYLQLDKNGSWYYHCHSIDLQTLKEIKGKSVFLEILLDAYLNGDLLSQQVGHHLYVKP